MRALSGDRLIKIKGLTKCALVIGLAVMSLPFWSSDLTASEGHADPLVVVYPEVRQPFLKVYETIARGAAKGYGAEAKEIKLGKKQDAQTIARQVNGSAVIALGGRAVSEMAGLELDKTLVVGAVSREIDQVFGLSMIPDAFVVADKLRNLAPSTRRVFVVVKPGKNIAQLATAQLALNQMGIQLMIEEAEGVREAANRYRALTDTLVAGDAVWVMPGDRFVNNALLAILLQAAWKSDFVVFSSNPTHVKRGALFSVYPDNFEMGVRLGEIARDVANGVSLEAKMEPLRSLFVTVNERTSNHLGIIITDDMKEHIDLILPAR